MSSELFSQLKLLTKFDLTLQIASDLLELNFSAILLFVTNVSPSPNS